jgi:transcriptional regulator with XRE-family HTH domain
MGRRTTTELRKPKLLGRKLAAIRKHLQLSQNELIRKLGFADELVREEISAFERGVRVPPVVVLLEMARAVNITVESLIDDNVELEINEQRDVTKENSTKQKRTSRTKH